MSTFVGYPIVFVTSTDLVKYLKSAMTFFESNCVAIYSDIHSLTDIFFTESLRPTHLSILFYNHLKEIFPFVE